MTAFETVYAVVLLAAAAAWPWLLAKAIANAISRARPAPPPPPPAIVQAIVTPTPECVVTFWNGCSIPIDKTRESDRLALASGMLLRFQWARRPQA